MFDIDNTTLTLLGILASLLIYHRFFSRASPLVHPLLLGKQSDVSAIRRKGETGVYRSFATGQGSPFTVRPSSGLKTVRDIAYEPKGTSSAQRCILDEPLDDAALSEILQLLPRGLLTAFPTLQTPQSAIITLLPPSTTTVFPLLLLQLSAPSPLVILPSPRFLATALTSPNHPEPGLVVVHVELLDEVVEQVWEDRQHRTSILVLGDPTRSKADVAKAAGKKGLVVKFWEGLWEVAEGAEKVDVPEPVYSDVHSYFYSQGQDQPNITKVTHINITAGIAGLLSIFPADKRPSSTARDVVASSQPLDTPFGMTIALASIYSGAGFRYIGNTEPIWPGEDDVPNHIAELAASLTDPERAEPKPTMLFISKDHHEALIKSLHVPYRNAPLASFAARHKLSGIQGGDVSRSGRFESLIWAPIRAKPLGGLAQRLRAVVVIGDAPPANILALSHLLLSLPISRIRASAFSTGPIFASHFYDLQCKVDEGLIERPKWEGRQAHVGPPGSNVEVLLKGPEIEEQVVEGDGREMSGTVWARGPGVLEVVGRDTKEGWTDLGVTASVQTNGTFVFGQ